MIDTDFGSFKIFSQHTKRYSYISNIDKTPSISRGSLRSA